MDSRDQHAARKKLGADIYIFRNSEDNVNTVKQLIMVEPPADNGKSSVWRMEEKEQSRYSAAPSPSLQLPYEVLEPLAVALREIGVDGASDSKLAGKLEAQAAHLKDLRDIALSFIGGEKPEQQIAVDTKAEGK